VERQFKTDGGSTSAASHGQIEDAIRATHRILANCGITISPSKVSRLVRRYDARVQQNGWTFIDFLATSVQLSAAQRRQALNDPEMERVISYRDPTGERAVRNVMGGNAA
jgi:hypothetical protein